MLQRVLDRAAVGGFALGFAFLLSARCVCLAGDRPAQKEVLAPGGAKKSESVVKISASAGKLEADGKQVLTVTLAIDKDWHTYANPVPKDFPGLPTTITVDGKAKPLEVKVDYPPGKLMKDATIGDYHVYEDKVEIKVLVQRAKGDAGPLDVSVTFQSCSDRQCLVHSTVKLTVP